MRKRGKLGGFRIYKVSVRLTAPVYDAALRLLEWGAYLNLSEL